MTPRLRRILKTSTIILASLLGATVLVVGAVLVRGYDETRDPISARTCECELLKQWATTLPLTPRDQHVQAQNVRVTGDNTGFQLITGLEDVAIDRQVILDTLTAHGFNHETDIDQRDFWNSRLSAARSSRTPDAPLRLYWDET